MPQGSARDSLSSHTELRFPFTSILRFSFCSSVDLAALALLVWKMVNFLLGLSCWTLTLLQQWLPSGYLRAGYLVHDLCAFVQSPELPGSRVLYPAQRLLLIFVGGLVFVLFFSKEHMGLFSSVLNFFSPEIKVFNIT